ncbi:MAG TPA: MFS transporter [Gaiellaceae bacterium]|nr:MFS transporter [Gaiellaceae bacterium]
MTAAFLRAHRRTWSSLRKHRNYRIFFAGQVVSVTGTWMQNVAAAWLVLTLTHSPIAVGVLMLCQFLPATALGLVGGVIVDRLDVRRVVIATQAASMVFAGALAALTLAGAVEVWHVYLLAGLRGISLVFDHPARQQLTFQMVGRAELPNAVALNSGLFNGTRVIGPALGGAVIATAGVGACFMLNAASFVAVLVSLAFIRPQELFPLDRGDDRPTLIRGSREAFAFLRDVPAAGLVLGLVLLVTTLSFNFNVLLPVLAAKTLDEGPEVFGIITAFFGAGALVGALTAASISRASPKILLAGTAAFGVAQLALAPQTTLVGAAPFLFAAGIAFTLWTSNANATLQLATPDRLRGRVMGLYYFAFNGAGPAGGMLAGWLAATGGTALAFTVAGASAITVSALAFMVFARLSERRRLAPRPGTVSA